MEIALEKDSLDFTRVQQSLDRIDETTQSGGKGGRGDRVVTLRPAPDQGPVDCPAWWRAPLKSYYPQLAWGRICSFFQPAVNHQFSGSEILPDLWISDHASVCDLQALRDRNIHHIVCAVLGIRALFPRHFQYTRLPLRDTDDENIFQYFDCVADLINVALNANQPVVVHCRCGVSRSVSLVCAYLIKHRHKSVDQAIRMIQEKRPCANPIQTFRHQLKAYEERFK